jgi:hypothetical protein
MEVRVQLHVLPSKNKLPLPIGSEARWALEAGLDATGEEEKLSSC